MHGPIKEWPDQFMAGSGREAHFRWAVQVIGSPGTLKVRAQARKEAE